MGNEIGAGQPYLLCRFFLFCLKAVSWAMNVSNVLNLWYVYQYCKRLQSVRFVRLHIMNIYKLWAVYPVFDLYVSSCTPAVGNKIDPSISSIGYTDSCIFEHLQLNYKHFHAMTWYYKCLQAVNCVRLQARSVRFEDVGCVCLYIARVFRLWALGVSILWLVYYVCTFRTSPGWLSVSSVCTFNTIRWEMKLELSSSHLCSICTINSRLQFSVSGWSIPISWRYLIIRVGTHSAFGRGMTDLQVIYY